MAMALASFSVASSSSLLPPPRLAPPSPSLPAPAWLARPAALRLGSRLPSQTTSDVWRSGPCPPSCLSSVTVTDVGQTEECSTGGASASSLKQSLLDLLHSTTSDRGLRASAETRAEIIELIAQLEAINPTPAPTKALTLLDGKWILAYTSFLELFPLLTVSTMPLVKVGEISQTIDSTAFTVQNSVSYTGPLATTSFSTTASFEIQSPKRVQIKFEEGVIGTPQLTDSIEIPENVEVLGSKIDLQPVQSFLRSLQDTASSVVKTVSERPPLKIPITSEKVQSWLLTTYLDEDLRISRVDGGSVFVLIKQGSPLLTTAI